MLRLSAIIGAVVAFADNLAPQLALRVTATPWCNNSFRIQVSPASASSSSADARLRSALATEDLQEVPSALITQCGPGTPSILTPGAPAIFNGNAAVQLLVNGDLRVFRNDTNATLFEASYSLGPLSFAGTCARGFATYGSALRTANMTIASAAASCAAESACAAISVPTGQAYACDAQQPLDNATIVPVTFVANKTFTDGDAGWRSWASPALAGAPGFLGGSMGARPGDATERFFGLGQGGWTLDGHCASAPAPQLVVPLERNGQTLNLHQRKFHVTIPFVYSTAGYGFLWNLPSSGAVSLGEAGRGGMAWSSEATLGLDTWVTVPPAGAGAAPGPIYKQYADATGHAPPLRDDAQAFWQSRNRYKSSAIALSVAERYASLSLPVGMLVVDYENQVADGDFDPNPACYPSVANLSAAVRSTLNATTAFSFWPEVLTQSSNYDLFRGAGCLTNPDLGGYALDTTIAACRDLIWTRFLKPNYYDQGVSAYWLDETDGEGTGVGDGEFGYNTSYGPAAAYSNLWVNSWLQTFSDPVAALGAEPPLVLARSVWAGGQRYGVVLWSSDIDSSFEELMAQVNLGVHASLSGIPWWTSDVGGYGCSVKHPNNSSYMQELIVRWYQFGVFSPVFRTHGCRQGASEPDVAPCINVAHSCGPNEVWSYGNDTQAMLETYIRFRTDVLKPYIAALAANVTRDGVPTVRPLWWEFPDDPTSWTVNDQFLLGPDYLVAPVTQQGATNRSVVFPAGATWVSVWNASERVVGGVTRVVAAPLATVPAYVRA